MRVLAITNMYPPHHYGGYELLCQGVLDRFCREGHHVTVLTSTVRVAGVEDTGDAAVFRELSIAWDDHRLVRPSWRERRRRVAADVASVRAALDRERPDVVSVWHMGALSMAVLSELVRRRVPTVFVVCDDWLVYAPDLDPWLGPLLGRPLRGAIASRLTGLPVALPDLDALGPAVFISEATRAIATESGRWQLSRTAVSHAGIEPADFPVGTGPVAARPWRWRLLHVGRLDPRKGIDTAVRALPHLPAEARLDVIGRGDARYRAELEALARHLGVSDRVSFSVASRSELAARYRDADVLCFPVRWDEPFGLVPLEAMACDTPVVATGTGGSAEYLRDRDNALLFRAGEPESLAAAVSELASDADLRRRLVEGGRATASRFSIDRWATDLLAHHVAAAASSSSNFGGLSGS